jgi:REP element-mobilizing transposase RayT
MAHTHASVLVHCVFSTKNRADIILDCEALWRYLDVPAKDNKITLLAAGGTKNHVHMIMGLPPVAPLAKVMKEMKGSSSRWLHEHGYRFALAGRIRRVQRQSCAA